MKLKKITIITKITDIIIHRLPLTERTDDESVPAFLYKNDRETLCINSGFKWPKKPDNEVWWTIIFTHETLHRLLTEIGCDKLDNLFPNIRKSTFFVIPDW